MKPEPVTFTDDSTYPVIELREMLEAIWKFWLPEILTLPEIGPLAIIVCVPAVDSGTVNVALHDPPVSAFIILDVFTGMPS